MVITPNMTLVAWTSEDDDFDHNQLATDLALIDGHDHSPGKGKKLNAATSIISESITDDLIAPATITGDKVAGTTITGSNIAPETITDANITEATITGDKIAADTITDSLIANATITGGKIAAGTVAGTNIAEFTIAQGNMIAGAGFAEGVFTGFSYTVPASVSQIVYAQAEITITAPLSPGTGAIFGVVTTDTTGATPVTVEWSGGHKFNFPGGTFGGVDSFLLGGDQAYAIFIYIGGGWQCFSGGQDSGWIPLTLGTNVTTNSVFYTPSVRLKGDQVFLKGFIENISGSNILSGDDIFTIPAGLWPGKDVAIGGSDPSAVYPGPLLISTTGHATLSPNFNNGAQLGLDGMSYSVN